MTDLDHYTVGFRAGREDQRLRTERDRAREDVRTARLWLACSAGFLAVGTLTSHWAMAALWGVGVVLWIPLLVWSLRERTKAEQAMAAWIDRWVEAWERAERGEP